jgi:pimeloyl-ACP methyl ester carboxylesterase
MMANGGAMTESRPDPAVMALSRLVPGGVVRHRLTREQGRQLSWIEAGPAAPVVVLVAGAGEVGLDWAVILPALAEHFRVITYDRAGLGASDRNPRLTCDSQVHDLAALLDAVGPTVLVGHSWGGLIAELTTLARPELVLGLVLVDPFHEEMPAAVPLPLRAASNIVLTGIVLLKAVGLFPRIATAMGRQLAERCTDDPAVQTLLIDAYLASYATITQVATIRAENRLANTSRRAIRAARALSTVSDVPMRILTATRGKPQALQQQAHHIGERTATTFRRGQYTAVADSGHYIHKDQPSAVLAAIHAVAADVAQDRSREP